MQRTEMLVMLGESLRLVATLQHDLGVIYCDLLMHATHATHSTHSTDATESQQQLTLARDRITELQQRLTRTRARIAELHVQLGDDGEPARQRSSDEALRATQRIPTEARRPNATAQLKMSGCICLDTHTRLRCLLAQLS
jgi:hypothetical protein